MKKFLSDVLVDCNLTVSGTTSLGAATGVTVSDGDNSLALATTAWVTSHVSTNSIYSLSVPSGTTTIRLASANATDDVSITAAGSVAVSRVSDSEIRLTGTNNYLSSATFNTTNGVLTLGRQGLSDITVDLDNRFLTSESDTLDTVTSRDGVTTNTIGVGTVNVTGSTEGAELLTVDGTYGRLFTVTDDLSDSLFSVNTVAGLPAFEVFADNTIKIGAFANPITIDSSSNISIPGTITASGYNDSNWNTAFNDRITAAAVSGTSTKTLTLTQGDGSTITASWTDIEGTGADGYVSDVALNGNSLDFTAVGSGFAGSIDLSGITTDLTGYATEQYVLDNSDDYGSWNLKTNGVQRTTVQSGGNLDIVAGTNVSVSYGAGGVVTISSTDTNTDTNNYITGLAFNTANGVLTATRQGLGDLTVDLDGRYASSSHNHDSRYIRKDIVDSFTGLTNDAYDETPGFLRGVISLRPGSAGGTTGIGFSTTVNVNTETGQDYGYVWWYDDNNNYAFGDGSGENAALILGIQNDSSTTDFGGTQDAVVLESSANIFFNPGLAGVGTGGVGGPDFTQGKVYIGRADEAYEVYHQGNLVNVSQLTNDAGYLTSFSETDPVFTAHVSSGITATNISNWNVAYGWGDHSNAGYLTSVPSQYLTQTEGDNRYKLFSEELLPARPEQAAPPDSYPLGLYLTDSESSAPYSWVRDAGIVWGIHPANANNRHLQFIANHDGSELLMRMKNGTADEWRDWNHLATRSWVSSQNFGDATESWVESRGYLTSETVTSLSLSSNILRYTDENGTNTDLDLSLYLDDSNLARLTSGTLDGNTGIATFTRDDNSTFTVDFSGFLTDANNYADSLAFSTSTGVLTLGRSGSLSNLTVDLDGRYHESGTPLVLSAKSDDIAGSRGYAATGNGDSSLDAILANVALNFESASDEPSTIYFKSGVNAPSDFAYISFLPNKAGISEEAVLQIGVENDGAGSSDYIRLQGRTVTAIDYITSESSNIHEWWYQTAQKGRIDTSGNMQLDGSISVSGGDSAQWNAAYSWGNHATQGYLTTVSWDDVTSKPLTFTPSAHTHDASDIVSGALNADRLPWAETDGFSGTYSIVWRATNTPYTCSWLQVRGSDDTLLTRNISATGSITLTGAIGLAQAVNIDHGAGDGDAAGTVIETFDTGVFIGAFLDFTIYNDEKSAMRSGTLQLVFNPDEVMFNEVNTMDIGDTTPCTLTAVNNGGSVEVVFTTPDPTFHIKYHVRTL